MALLQAPTNQAARSKALSVYRKFFDKSVMSKSPNAPFTNFDGFISAIDKFGLIEGSGDVWYNVSDANIERATTDAAKKNQTKYTWANSDLQNEMAKYIRSSSNTSTLDYASTALKETGVEIGKDIYEYSQIFSKIVIWGVVLYGVGYLLMQMGGVEGVKKIGKKLKG